ARVDALRSIGGFDGRVPYCADWLAWMQLALRHDVAMAHQHLVRWRQHPDSGTSESLVSASYAIEDPAALRRALADDAFPAAWRELRAPMLAACLTRTATHLERDGHRRAAHGPAALGLAVQALALAPAEEALHALVVGLAVAAGQSRPHVPVELVAAPGDDAAALAEALGLARRLRTGGLLRSFVVTVPAALLERSAAAIEDDLTRNGDIDVDLVAAVDASPLLRPGMLTAAALGSTEASLAESLGIPVAGLAWPDPFAREPDADVTAWQAAA
ncbi:MAG: hypothetical protein ACTHNU_14450, partial [Gaiellales bacterium]